MLINVIAFPTLYCRAGITSKHSFPRYHFAGLGGLFDSNTLYSLSVHIDVIYYIYYNDLNDQAQILPRTGLFLYDFDITL